MDSFSIEDMETIVKYFKDERIRTGDRTFLEMYIWRELYNFRIKEMEGVLCAVALGRGKFPPFVYAIAGKGDKRSAILYLKKYFEKIGAEFLMRYVTNEIAEELKELFPGELVITPVRDDYDYVYESDELANIPSGKKHRNIRSQIRDFALTYDYRYHTLDEGVAEACIEYNDRWFERGGRGGYGLSMEKDGIRDALRHFKEIGVIGGAITIGDRIVAYSLGERVSEDMTVVHTEKADKALKGAYKVIMNEFAANECGDTRYINREQDMGIEGLRRAKTALFPAFFIEKSNVRFGTV